MSTYIEKLFLYPFLILLTVLCSINISDLSAQDMDNEGIQNILMEVVDSLEGSPGFWQIIIEEIPIMIVTDETHNRMRIICHIK